MHCCCITAPLFKSHTRLHINNVQLWIFYYSAEKTTKGFPKVNKEHEITTKINCSLVASDQTILSETIKQSDTCVTKGPYSLNFSTKIVTVIEY